MTLAGTHEPVDRVAMLERLGGDEQLFAEAIAIFLEDFPGRLADIRSALDDGDPRSIRSSAHALRGAAGMLAARELFEAAKAIELLGDAGKVYDAREAWSRLSNAAVAVAGALKQS